jgi:hypothetical protein
MNSLYTKLIPVLALFVLVLAACAPGGALAAESTAAPTVLPVPTGIPTVQNTPTASIAGGGTDGGGGSSTNIITLDNNNQLITLHVGETFLLKLGEVYDWNLNIDDVSVISRVINVMVIRGAQGLYTASQPGKAVLTAQGDPTCRQSKPACMMASIIFTLHIEVLQ